MSRGEGVAQRRCKRSTWARARRGFVAAMTFLILPPFAAGAERESVPRLIAQMDEHWQARRSGDAARQLIETGQRALAIDPDNFEVAWRIARGSWWLANSQENRSFKKALAVKAMEWAARAVEIDPRRVEGHYTHGISVGEYATCIGYGRAIVDNIVGKFETSMRKSYELDPDIDNGGPMTALGRFYYMLPWPKRDLDESRRLLEELRMRHPNALLGRVYLAETYYEIGERNRARSELEYVVRAEPSPSWPELPKPKPIAEQLLSDWSA